MQIYICFFFGVQTPKKKCNIPVLIAVHYRCDFALCSLLIREHILVREHALDEEEEATEEEAMTREEEGEELRSMAKEKTKKKY
jgi:hypothetical protein